MRKEIPIIAAIVVIIIGASVCYVCLGNDGEDKKGCDTIYQVSLLDALKKGDYYGSVTVGELKQHGDTGLGTFDTLNGEMIIYQGVVYQALSDGTVRIADDSTTVPFANTAYMETDFSESDVSAASIDVLENSMTQKISSQGKNSMYVAVIEGTFDTLTIRSEKAQTEPYEPLDEVLKHDEVRWEYTSITGTIVALYFPEYAGSFNSAGWHLHFISEDRTIGGHVHYLSVSDCDITYNKITTLDVVTPTGDYFQSLDFSA